MAENKLLIFRIFCLRNVPFLPLFPVLRLFFFFILEYIIKCDFLFDGRVRFCPCVYICNYGILPISFLCSALFSSFRSPYSFGTGQLLTWPFPPWFVGSARIFRTFNPISS